MEAPPQKFIFQAISDEYVQISSLPYPLPVTEPSISKVSQSFLSARKMGWLNGLVQWFGVKVMGSLWLPGFYVLNEEQAREAVRECKDSRVHFAVTSVPIKGKEWRSFIGDPFMVLTRRENWLEMTDYTSQLKQKYRARYKKTMQATSGGEVRQMDLSQVAQLEACASLLANTLVDKVIFMPKDLKGLLQKFVTCFGEQFEVWGFFEGEDLQAFISVVRDGEVLRAMHFGKRPDAKEQWYSRAMFHVIECGIIGHYHKIHLGRTATEIKSTYGAEAVENYMSFHTTRRRWRWLFDWAERKYKPKQYTLRQALKEN